MLLMLTHGISFHMISDHGNCEIPICTLSTDGTLHFLCYTALHFLVSLPRGMCRLWCPNQGVVSRIFGVINHVWVLMSV